MVRRACDCATAHAVFMGEGQEHTNDCRAPTDGFSNLSVWGYPKYVVLLKAGVCNELEVDVTSVRL